MILRYVVALPCFNNRETIESVILDVLQQTAFPVLVVDDGSDEPVESILKSSVVKQARDVGRLHFLRHPKNRGKGAALQTAFAWSVENNFTHLISCDTDGQHLARETDKLVKESRAYPWSLVIGSRQWQGDVPDVSKFGRKFSNFWVNFETGYDALDSQSGFRIYPLFFVQNLSFFTKKYDFEIEVLIRLLWNKVEVREVDVEVVYPPADERVSHFDKLWDNVRISLLNCVLVAVSLLRGHTKPARSAVALGMGIFIGVTPFFGVHFLFAAAAALFLRLNFLLLFIGTQISLPFIAPFIAYASIHIGQMILGKSEATLLRLPRSFAEALEISKIFFSEWLVGSLVLGVVLGAAVGGIYYLFKKWYLSQKNQAWTGKTRGGKLGNGFLKLILKYIGLRAGYFCLLFIVPYFYLFAPRARKSLNTYWSGIRRESSWLWRQGQILKHFYTFGQVLMDRVYQSYQENLAFEIRRDGPIYIDEVAASGRGWVFIGAHIGGWDISSLFFKKDPRSARLGMVHFLAEGLTFDKVLSRKTENSKVDSIQSGAGQGSLITVKQFLENNQHVGFLADRAIGTQIELVPFLGKLAPFETRPFRVAAACKAPLIHTYNFKLNAKTYNFLTANHSELVYSADKDRILQVYEWTQNFVRDLEHQVRKYPHQWFNFYPFWSSLPVQMQGASQQQQDCHLLEELNKPAKVPVAQGSAPLSSASTESPS